MRSGRSQPAAAPSGTAAQPSSRYSNRDPSVADDTQEHAAAKRPRRPGRKHNGAASAGGQQAGPLMKGTADSQQEPAANGNSSRAVTKGRRPSINHRDTVKQRVRMSQQQQGANSAAVVHTGPVGSKRVSGQPARTSKDRNNTKSSVRLQQRGRFGNTKVCAGSADQASDDSGASDQSEGNSSNSAESSSDSESEQEAAAAAAAETKQTVQKRSLNAAQNKRQQQRKQKKQPRKPAANSRRNRRGATADDASHSRLAQKGPLSRVKAADAAPLSSNTTTTTSTQLLGGAARPIPEITSYRQAVRRVNHQIQRISTEEHLLQTYTADGWKGASKEKVRLTDDLKRAQQTLARCKESIRQACRYCEEVHAGPPIPPSSYDSDGEVDVTHIFCAKCGNADSTDDNDMVLCDGPCNRAYHECCLTPRLVVADLPEDEGWLCPACDAKMDILIQINDYYGTEYELEVSWQDLFNESPEEQEALQLKRLRSGELTSPRAAKAAAAAAAGGFLAQDFPSEDEEDNSYSTSDHDEVQDKHRPRKQRRTARRNTASKALRDESSSGGSSSGIDSSHNDEDSSSSSDDEAASLHSEGQMQQSQQEDATPDGLPLRRSQRRTAVNGVAAAAIAAGASPRNMIGNQRKASRVSSAAAGSDGGHKGKSDAVKRRRRSGVTSDENDSEQGAAADEPQKRQQRQRNSGRRKRRRGNKVDYKQLHEQLFGFTAFEGDDDVFREDDDDDYETDTNSEQSD